MASNYIKYRSNGEKMLIENEYKYDQENKLNDDGVNKKSKTENNNIQITSDR